MPPKNPFEAFIDHHCNDYDALDVELHAGHHIRDARLPRHRPSTRTGHRAEPAGTTTD
jgi:hypothetical protein